MDTVRRSGLAAALAATTAALAAAPAHAADRFVSPAGASTTCIQADPCSLATALANSVPNDSIYVSPGPYTLSATLVVPGSVTLRGTANQPRPQFSGSHGIKLSPGATARYLGIVTTGSGQHGLELDGATARDISVWTEGAGASAVLMRNHTAGTLLQDSVVVTKVKDVHTLQMKDSSVSPGGNSTVLATTVAGLDGADGIKVQSNSGSNSIVNTVTWGTDEIAVQPGSTLDAKYSNFRPAAPAGVVDGGGNQAAKPCWVAQDDVRPLSTSPTVDAGFADPRLGANDPEGVPRSPADVGVYEWQPSNDAFGTDCLYPTFDPDDPGGDTDTGTDTGGGTTTPPPPPADTQKPEPTTTSTTGSGTTTEEPTQLPPPTPPVLNTSVTVGQSKGTVLIRLPGSNTLVPLTADATIPLGAVIDATNGTVELTSATDSSGKTQTGQFWGGQFKVRQTKDRYTELVLSGDALDSCKSKKGTKSKKKGPNARSLWGRDRNGRFRTRGRNGTATVRGTRWLTEDRCDGTLFRVTQGAIDVRDNVEKKTIRLKAGDRYFADDKSAKKKPRRKR